MIETLHRLREIWRIDDPDISNIPRSTSASAVNSVPWWSATWARQRSTTR